MALALVVTIAAPCAAVPLEVDVATSADTFVRSEEPGLNYGQAGGLAVSGSEAVNASGRQRGILDTFLRFDTAALVAAMDAHFGTHGWIIQGVTLRILEQARPNNPIYNRGVGRFEVRWIAADNWIEGTGTPKNPTTDGVVFSDEGAFLNPAADLALGAFLNNGPEAPDDFIEVLCPLSLPAELLADIRAGGEVSLFLTAVDESIGLQFAARENIDPTGHPVLAVVADLPTIIPEPATACLLALGLLAGVGRSRRRRR